MEKPLKICLSRFWQNTECPVRSINLMDNGFCENIEKEAEMNKLNFFFAILLCIFSLSFLASNMASADVLLSEDFESVTPGGIPPDWWSDVWVSQCFHRAWVEEIDSNNVLSMSCDWASVAGPSSLVLLDYAVEADVYMMLRDDPNECWTGLTKGAIFYLRSYTKGTYHQRGDILYSLIHIITGCL